MQDPSSLATGAAGLTGQNLLIWLAISQVVIFLTAMATLVFNYLKDGRTRLWLEQDRIQQAKDATARSTALADHTSLTAAGIRELTLEKAHKVEIDLMRLAGELAETKQAASAAYKEANHVNIKISDYNQRLLEAQVGNRRSTDPAQAPLSVPATLIPPGDPV